MKPFCVADLFELSPFKKARLLCGKEGLGRQINGINIIEAPDVVSWLQGGEVLLTNFYSLRALGGAHKFISGLAEKKLAALLVKIGVFVDEVPEELLILGEEYSLPIIELSRDVLYKDVAFAVTSRLLDDKVATLEYFKQAHECFINLSLAGASVQEIMKALDELVDNPVALCDKSFNALYHSDDCVLGAVSQKTRREASPYFERLCRFPKHNNAEYTQFVFPLSLVKHVKLYLVISEIRQSLQTNHLIAIESAIKSLSIELLKQHAVAEVKKRFQSDLLDDLLDGHFGESDKIRERAALLGWDLDRHYAVVSFNIGSKGAGKTESISEQNKDYDSLYTMVARIFPHNPIQLHTTQLVLLWPVPEAGGKPWLGRIQEQLMDLKDKWDKSNSLKPLYIGVGDAAESLQELARSFKESEDALLIAQKNENLGLHISVYPELGVYRLLCSFENKRDLLSFLPKTLQILLQSKQSMRSELLRTLEVYLNCGQNISKAAELLHLHNKTVGYRLDQIKKLTDLNLANADELLQIQLGYRILQLVPSMLNETEQAQ